MELKKSLLRKIPSVDTCLQADQLTPFIDEVPHQICVDIIRKVQADWRNRINEHENDHALVWNEKFFFSQVKSRLESYRQGYLKRVINATGIIVHTNLGRSIISPEIADKISDLITGYNNLEYDLSKGRRSSRYDHLVYLLRQLTGYDDSLIVNNNAAAVLLLLDTFAKGKEVIVSRSELVEIGGGFRIPDVMKKAGVNLIEVGCTNKTYIGDFRDAITENTGMIIKVHRSNFQITGFTAEPTLQELSDLAAENKIPFLFDLGSGNLLPDELAAFPGEPTIQSCYQQGVDILSFSGDKLLGGPQAGIILGTSDTIKILKKNQLLRALRVDKMCLAALEATLKMYLRPISELEEAIPTVGMLTASPSNLKRRCSNVRRRLQKRLPETTSITIVDGFSQLGGGSLPEQNFQTYLLAISTPHQSIAELDQKLRENSPPVIGRIVDDKMVFDLRTVLKSEEPEIIQALVTALES